MTTTWVFVFLLLGICSVQAVKTGNNFTIAGIGPWSQPYKDFLTFAKYAAYLLNNNDELYTDFLPGILPNTTLIVETYDVGQTDPGLAAVDSVKASEQSNFLAYLGGARTAQQQQVVYVADNLHIPYVGGIVSGATFSDKSLWPYFSRTSLTDQFMSQVMVEFIFNIGIRTVALVYQDDDFGTGNYAAFSLYAQQYGIAVNPFEVHSLGTDFTAQAEQVKAAENRVIVVMTEYAEGLTFLTNSSTVGLVGPEYLWIWSQVFTQSVSRSRQAPQVYEWVQGSILFHPYADNTTDLAKLMGGYWNDADITQGWNVSTYPTRTPDTVAWYLADAVFTIALGLHEYIENGYNMSNKVNGTILHNLMCLLSFEGVSGNVTFNHTTCDRFGTYLILNYANNGTVLNSIQTYSPTAGFSETTNQIQYYDGTYTRPRDLPCPCILPHGKCLDYTQNCTCESGYFGQLCDNQVQRHSVPLGIVLGIIVGMSIIVSFAAFLVLILKKHMFSEKSPLFCGFIIFGTIIAYIGALMPLPEPTNHLCMSFPWLIGIGFTFVFGCLFLKTWRVYHIIDTSMKMERVVIGNMYIVRLVGVALLIEIIFMIVWTVTDPMRAAVHRFEDGSYRLQCYSKHQNVFWAVFGGYKACWMVFGAVMAVKTRYYYDEYNDSRAIAMSIYNTIATLAIGAPIAIVLRNYPYVVTVVEVAIVVVMFNFTLISIFFNLWMTIIFGEAIELPDLKPQQGGATSRSSKSGSGNEKSSSGNSNDTGSKKTNVEVYVA